MKKTLLAIALTGLLCSVTGCASSPLSQWFRGAPCNTCNLPVAQPFGAGSIAGGCGTGTCEQPRRGFFDWFRKPTAPSLPSTNFPADPGVQYYGDPGIPAGTIQPLEIINPVGSTNPITSPIGSGVLNQGSIAPNSLSPSPFPEPAFGGGTFGGESLSVPTEFATPINEFGSSISGFESSIDPTLTAPRPTPAPLTFGKPVSGELYGSGIKSGIPPIGPDGF